MHLEIPNNNPLTIETLILDLNGTITLGGVLVPGVEEKIKKLKQMGLKVVLFSGDTRGTAASIATSLDIGLILTQSAEDKRDTASKLNPETCATIGNGLIDTLLFNTVKLRIAVLQKEGLHARLIAESDVITPSILDALDLLLDPKSLIATLRK